jgi:hypothetical protein
MAVLESRHSRTDDESVVSRLNVQTLRASSVDVVFITNQSFATTALHRVFQMQEVALIRIEWSALANAFEGRWPRRGLWTFERLNVRRPLAGLTFSRAPRVHRRPVRVFLRNHVTRSKRREASPLRSRRRHEIQDGSRFASWTGHACSTFRFGKRTCERGHQARNRSFPSCLRSLRADLWRAPRGGG